MTLRERFAGAAGWLVPVVLGLLIAFAGVAPWVAMIRLNAEVRPDLPWAALATLVWLALFLFWLNGGGPPARWRPARRYRLRLWRAGGEAWSKEGIGTTLALIGMIALLGLAWILLGAPRRPPDPGQIPSTAYIVSAMLMGPLVAAIVEEAAFRGYMQRGLERYGPQAAILVSALLFALAHAGQGLTALLLLGPGIFFAGLLYGMLAWHTGSILPGIIVHFLSDLFYFYFGILGGDWRLLIVH